MDQEYDHLLIDVKNALYRAIYSGIIPDLNRNQAMLRDVTPAHPLTTFFRFMAKYINMFKPKNVHFFWDCKQERLWRKRIYPEYKAGRDHSRAGVDVEAILKNSSEAFMEMIPHLNSRSYQLDHQEADDLIYAFCRQFRNSKTVIVSNDSDFVQIAYLFNSVDVYCPMGKKKGIVQVPTVDPVIVKSLMGETGDNIEGYNKIGIVTATKIASDHKIRADFFSKNDGTMYRRNRVLIDLTLCPYLLQNLFYVDEVMVQPTKFDMKAIYDIIQRYKVKGLAGEVAQVIYPYKHVGKEPVKEN
jgi:5'-3' exonuclease